MQEIMMTTLFIMFFITVIQLQFAGKADTSCRRFLSMQTRNYFRKQKPGSSSKESRCAGLSIGVKMGAWIMRLAEAKILKKRRKEERRCRGIPKAPMA